MLQLRWKPFDIVKKAEKSVDFVAGLHTVAGAGDPKSRHGCVAYVYMCNTSMEKK